MAATTEYKKMVDDLIKGKHLLSAAILGKDGSIQASSPGFQVSKDEAKALADGFEHSDVIAQKGLSIAGKKYQFLSKTANFIKTKGAADKGGSVVGKTQKNIVLGVYDEKMGVDNCTKALEAVTEKLKKSGL